MGSIWYWETNIKCFSKLFFFKLQDYKNTSECLLCTYLAKCMYSLLSCEGGSLLRECESCYCKIRSLRMRSIICRLIPHVFILFPRGKFNFLELFYQSLANNNVKVNKLQQISANIDSDLDSLSEFWNFRISCGINEIEQKDKIMEKSAYPISISENSKWQYAFMSSFSCI